MKPKPYILLPYYYPLSDPEGDKDYRVPHTKQKRKVRSSQDISIDAISKMRTDIMISPHDVIKSSMNIYQLEKLKIMLISKYCLQISRTKIFFKFFQKASYGRRIVRYIFAS